MGVIKVAGDGDCLFHALAFFDFSDGAALRIEVADFMEAHAAEQAGFEEEWRREVVKLRQNKWGGHNVIAAYSLMKQRRVTIHTRRDGADPPVVVQEASHGLVNGNEAFPMVHVLYNGKDHYDALVEVFDKSNAKPAWPQPPPPMYLQVVGNNGTTGAKDFPPLDEAVAATKAGSKAGNKKGLEGPRPQQAGKAKAKARPKAKAKGKSKPKPKPSSHQPGTTNQSDDAKLAEGDCKDQPAPAASDNQSGETGGDESMEPGLMEHLEALPVASTSGHPHRKVEDLIKDSTDSRPFVLSASR